MVQLWRTIAHHLLNWIFPVYPSFLSVLQEADLMDHIRELPGLLEVNRCHRQAAEDTKRAGCALLVACFQVSCLGLQNSKSCQEPFSHSYFFWFWCFMSCPFRPRHGNASELLLNVRVRHPSLLGFCKTLLCLCRLFTTTVWICLFACCVLGIQLIN